MSGQLKLSIFSLKLSQFTDQQTIPLYIQFQLGKSVKRSSLIKYKINGKNSQINESFEFQRESNDEQLVYQIQKDDESELGMGNISFQQLIENKQKTLWISVQFEGKKIGELGIQREFVADMKSRAEFEEMKKKNQELNSQINQIRNDNEQLRTKLKAINQILNKKIDQTKLAKTINQKKIYLENKVLLTEIENAQTQICQQEIQQKQYLNKLKELENLNIAELEANYKNQLQQKQQFDKKLKQIQRDVTVEENKIYYLTSENEEAKIQKITGEVTYLQEKQKKLENFIETQTKNNKFAKEYSEKLNQKINQICTEKQLDLNLIKKQVYEENERIYYFQKNDQTAQTMQSKNQQKNKNQAQEDDINVNKYEITQENIEKLKKKYLNYKVFLKKNELAQQHELKILEDQQSALELSLKQIQGKIKEKEKEITLSEQRSQEMRKFVKFNQLSPLELDPNYLTKLQAITSKQLLKACVNQKNKINKRIAKGGIFTENIIEFDDIDSLLDQIPLQIVQLDFFRDEENTIIYGFQATYCFNDINNIKKSNLNMDYRLQDKIVTETLKFQKEEYIKNIAGLATDTIDFLKIETNLGQILKIGTINLKQKSLEFELETEYMYRPIILFGGLDYKQQGENYQLALAYIGIEQKNFYFPTSVNHRNNSAEKQYKKQEQYQNRFRNYLKRKPKDDQTSKEPIIKRYLQIKGNNETLNEDNIKTQQLGQPIRSERADQKKNFNKIKKVK